MDLFIKKDREENTLFRVVGFELGHCNTLCCGSAVSEFGNAINIVGIAIKWQVLVMYLTFFYSFNG